MLSKLLLSNVQSLKSNIDELNIIVDKCNPDIVCLTETWLSSDVDNDLVRLNNFSPVRSDRKERKGGGTAIYIREGIVFEEVTLPENFCCEIEGTFIQLTQLRLAIFCLYIPLT